MIQKSIIAAALALTALTAHGATPPKSILPFSPAEFERLHTLIKPQAGESPWREIDWLTNVTEARQRSVAENKPIVIFTAADGSPLGRT